MKIIVILGPTGVGKTKLSIEIAKDLNASIINADSTQIYKETSVGVAKITKEEMEDVPHYMLDVTSLNDEYTVKDYQRDARRVLNQLIKEDKNVIIVGGSFLYVKALLYDYKFSDESGKIHNYDNFSNEELKRMVDHIYSDNDIHVNNRKRLLRFLVHYDETGEIIRNTINKDIPMYDFILLGLKADREQLYSYLNKRVEIMMCDGFIEEARTLFHEGYKKAESLIGYKEFIEYFKGNLSLLDAVNITKQKTRNYAKKQFTWLNNQFTGIKWFDVNYECFDETIKKVRDYLNTL